MVVQIEANRVDCLIKDVKNKKTMAVEIELNSKWAVCNIRRDMQLGCDVIVVLCKNEQIMGRIKSRIKSELPDKCEKIHCYLIDNYIHLIRKIIINKSLYWNSSELNTKSN